MTAPMTPAGRGRRPAGRVDAGRLWSGGVATAAVAGLVALVGVLVCRWLFNIPVLAPKKDGAYGDVHTTAIVLVAAAAALAATGFVDLVIGIAIGSLVSSVAARSVRRHLPGGQGYAPIDYMQTDTEL